MLLDEDRPERTPAEVGEVLRTAALTPAKEPALP